jgi:hypothetical protein
MAIMEASQERVRSHDGCQPRIDEGLPSCDGGQEQTEAEIKTGLKEIKAMESDTVAEHQDVPKDRPQWRPLEHWWTNLRTSDQPGDTGTHRKDGPRTMLYEEPLKGGRLRRDVGCS